MKNTLAVGIHAVVLIFIAACTGTNAEQSSGVESGAVEKQANFEYIGDKFAEAERKLSANPLEPMAPTF